jgi:hypothetical protein
VDREDHRLVNHFYYTPPQRRRPQTEGDDADKHDRWFIGPLVERFRHFNNMLRHLVTLHAGTLKSMW